VAWRRPDARAAERSVRDCAAGRRRARMKDESRPTLPTERMRSALAEPSRLGGAQEPASRT
jgi:hypothetical protein